MIELAHRIRKQQLQVDTDSEHLALTLQARMGDINRQYLLPVISRVFEELAIPGRTIKIPRLDVDLGIMTPAELETEAGLRLYRELRRALEEALRGNDFDATAQYGSQTEQASRLEWLRSWLLNGSLPFSAPRDFRFSLEAFMLDLARSDPADLVDLIRALGLEDHVPERLAMQLGSKTLERLVHLLEPEHAALIIAYLFDVSEIHHAAPIIPLSDRDFGRLLWVLVLAYLLRDPGSHFNRKSFVTSLLEGIAESESLDFYDILVTLRSGLEVTRVRRPMGSSLPAVLEELMQEIGIETAANDVADEASSPLEEYLDIGVTRASGPSLVVVEELFRDMLARDPAALVRLIRRRRMREGVLERLILDLPIDLLHRLIHLLEPEHAALIIAYLFDLSEIHRVRPVLPLSDPEFARVLLKLVFAYLLRDPGSQFNRKSFVVFLLQGIAARESLDFDDILSTLRSGLEQTRMRRPLTSSLLAVLNELLQDPEVEVSTVASVEEAPSPLEEYLDGSSIGVGEPSALAFERLLSELLTRDPAALVRLIRRRGKRRGVLERLVLDIPIHLLSRVIHLLEPEQAAVIIDFLIDLQDIHRVEPVLSLGERPFERLIWLLTLSYLVRDAGSQFNRKEFVQSLLKELASSESVRYTDIVETIRMGLHRAELVNPLKSSLVAVLHEIVLEFDAGQERATSVEMDQILRRVEIALAAGDTSALDDADLDILIAFAQSAPARVRRLLRSALPGRSDAVIRMLRCIRSIAASPAISELTEEVFQGAMIDAAAPSRRLPETFGHYDYLEVLRYILRHGVLPWSSILTILEGTPERPMSLLPSMPLSQIAAVFEADSRQERFRLAMAAARSLDSEDVSLLLHRFLPDSQGAETFWTSVEEFAANSVDRAAFLASLITAILEKEPLDLEELSLAEPLPSANYESLSTWDADRIKSFLLARLRGEGGEPSFSELLKALLARHRTGARLFLRTVGSVTIYRAALARQLTAPLFRQIVELLFGEEAESIQVLTQAIKLLPTRDRPTGLAVREAILQQPSPAQIVPMLFGESLPEQIRQHVAELEKKASASRRIEEAADHAEDDLLRFLSGEDSALDLGQVIQAITVAAENPSGELHAFLVEHLADNAARERWTAVLPDSALVRLAWIVEPRRHRILLDAAELLESAWIQAAPPGFSALTSRREFWRFLLKFLARHSGASLSVERLTLMYFEHFSVRSRTLVPDSTSHAEMGVRLLEQATRLALQGGRPALAAVLQRKQAIRTAWLEPGSNKGRVEDASLTKPRTPPTRSKRRTAFGIQGDEEEPLGSILYIGNAGLVLAAPFLPRFFEMLDMTEKSDGTTRWKSPAEAARATHLLQWLVDANESAPEPTLVLNKLLCGLDTAVPIDAGIEITDREIDAGEQLLKSMIANWQVIAQSSVAALRETFLQREGKLEQRGDRWKLVVQRKTLDVLVDQVPWSFSVIRLPWMPLPLYVTW